MDTVEFNSRNHEILNSLESTISLEIQKAIASLKRNDWSLIKNLPHPPAIVKGIFEWIYYLLYLSEHDYYNNPETISMILANLQWLDVRGSVFGTWGKFGKDIQEFADQKLTKLGTKKLERIQTAWEELGSKIRDKEAVRNVSRESGAFSKLLTVMMQAVEKLISIRKNRTQLNPEDTPVASRLTTNMGKSFFCSKANSQPRPRAATSNESRLYQ
jgi:hypothetical protein